MHDGERYLVEWSCGDEGSEVSMAILTPTWDHRPSTLREARAIAETLRAIHKRIGTLIEIACCHGPGDGQVVETWERVRRSAKCPTGWKHERN